MSNYLVGNTMASIKNGYMAKLDSVLVIGSHFVGAILSVIKKEGYIEDFFEEYKELSGDKKGLFYRIKLKYKYGFPVLQGFKLFSKPSRRKYVKAINGAGERKKHGIPLSSTTFGIFILSTSKGVITGSDALKNKIGGELLMEVF